MIPYGRQDITEADIEAVVAVLKSDFLTQGPVVPRFEQSVAMHVGARHALAVNSATSALHIACLALGLGAGDQLLSLPRLTAVCIAALKLISSILILRHTTSVPKRCRPDLNWLNSRGVCPRCW